MQGSGRAGSGARTGAPARNRDEVSGAGAFPPQAGPHQEKGPDPTEGLTRAMSGRGKFRGSQERSMYEKDIPVRSYHG